MWGNDGRESPQRPAPAGQPRVEPSSGGDWRDERGDERDDERDDEAPRREPGDALERMPGDTLEDGPSALSFPGAQSDVMTAAWLRNRNRALIREFLGSVPRSEPEATIALLRPDGGTALFTRAEFTTFIDRLRPRMRQIMRLANEERWPRQRVCDYLNGISKTTFERDHAEAFNALLQYVEER